MSITYSTKDVVDTILAENGFDAIIDDPFEFTLNGVECSIPTGFSFDWGSIPKAFWSLFPPRGRHSWACLIHDWLYRTQVFDGKPCAKSFADQVFLVVMKHYGVSSWRRQVMYWGVKCFGWSAWRNNRKKLK